MLLVKNRNLYVNIYANSKFQGEKHGVPSENYASSMAQHHMMWFIDQLNQIMWKILKHYTLYMAILP